MTENFSVSRKRLFLAFVAIVFVVIIGRLFYWQVIKSPELKEKALSQTYKLEIKNPSRGQIPKRFIQSNR